MKISNLIEGGFEFVLQNKNPVGYVRCFIGLSAAPD